MDLMFGLPDQTLEELHEDIDHMLKPIRHTYLYMD